MQIEAVAIFGVNPETNTHPQELGIRLACLQRVLSFAIPNRVIFLGGDSFSEEGHVYTEAEYIANQARTAFPELLPEHQIELAEGLETTSQTHALIDYLSSSRLAPETTGIISSWHQLLRTSPIFLFNTHRLPRMYPVFDMGGPAEFAYDLSINAIAGVGYTILAEILKNNPAFKDGGPIIRKINEERSTKNGRSWFNSMRRK